MPMTRLAGGEHCAIEYVQGGEQVGGAGTNEVVRDAFDVAESHRQHGLRAIERLALALLVHAQYQCVLRWAQVQADHVAQLLDEELIGREFEAFAAMRLQAQQLEVAVHTRRRDRRFGSDRAHAPVRGAIRWLGVQGLVNQLSQPLIINRARLAGTDFVIKSVDAMLQEPDTPFAHCGTCELQTLSNCAVGLPGCRSQHNARTRHQRSQIERERAIAFSCERSSSLNNSSAFGRPMGMLVSPVPLIPACYVNID